MQALVWMCMCVCVCAFVRAFLRLYGCALCYILSSCNGNDETQWNSLENALSPTTISSLVCMRWRKSDRDQLFVKYQKRNVVGKKRAWEKTVSAWRRQDIQWKVHATRRIRTLQYVVYIHHIWTHVYQTYVNIYIRAIYQGNKTLRDLEWTKKSEDGRQKWIERTLCQDTYQVICGSRLVRVSAYVYVYAIHTHTTDWTLRVCACMRVCVCVTRRRVYITCVYQPSWWIY